MEYCRGVDNVYVDFFSRNPEGKFEDTRSNHLGIDVLCMENQNQEIYNCDAMEFTIEFHYLLKNLESLQNKDIFIKSIKQKFLLLRREFYFDMSKRVIIGK